MANTLLTPSIIAREALLILENELVLTNLVHRGHTDEFRGAKVGSSITVRGPASFTANEFTSTVSVQDATESSVTLTLEKHFDVTFAVTASDMTLKLSDFREQLLEPAIVAIAQAIDAYLHSKYTEIHNQIGTAGDPPDSLADLALIDKALNDQKVPMGRGRFAVVDTQTKADMMGITAVVQAEQRGDGGLALREASMGRVMGVDYYMSQNVKTHTAGTLTNGTASLAKINNASVSVGDLTVPMDDTSLSGTVAIGDVFTVAGDTQQYVVTAVATAATNALASVAFLPAAKVAWANNAVVTFDIDAVANPTYKTNIAGHRNGMTAALVPLEIPMGANKAEYIGDRNLGIRAVYDYNINTKTDTISLDVLVGAKVQQPNLMLRIVG
jgi:hypothetical protein